MAPPGSLPGMMAFAISPAISPEILSIQLSRSSFFSFELFTPEILSKIFCTIFRVIYTTETTNARNKPRS